jgi:AmiR/NasT family two-component response regulator
MKFGKKNKKDSEQIVENSSESGGADLTKLSKKDLLEIMLRQGEEIDALRSEVQSLKDQLEAREIDINRVGSLAEASLAVTEIFKEADKAAMTYLSNLKRMAEGGVKK